MQHTDTLAWILVHSFVSLVQGFLQKHWLVKRVKTQIYLPSESLEKNRDCSPCSKKEVFFSFFNLSFTSFQCLWLQNLLFRHDELPKPLCYCWERRCLHQLCQHFMLWVPLYMAKKKKIHCAGKDAYICNTKSLYCATLKKGNPDIQENDPICIFHPSDLLLAMHGIC